MAESVTTNPTRERLVMALGDAGADAVIRTIFQMTTDPELTRYYEETDGREGNPIADLLAVEMERREIDF